MGLVNSKVKNKNQKINNTQIIDQTNLLTPTSTPESIKINSSNPTQINKHNNNDNNNNYNNNIEINNDNYHDIDISDDNFLCLVNSTIKYVTKKYGWIHDLPDCRDKHVCSNDIKLKLNNISYLKNSNSQLDLRDTMLFFPDVYTQGELGSSTANALAFAYQFDETKQNIPDVFIPSRLFIYYNERNIENTIESDSGASLRNGIKSINKYGVTDERNWPYIIEKFTEKPSEYCYQDASKHCNIEYFSVPQSLSWLRKILRKGFPIVFGFTVYESFESSNIAENGIMEMPKLNEKVLGGHAVVAIGFNTDKKHFIIRNSWGNKWGDNGYFYMPFEFIQNKKYCSNFWVIQKISNYQKNIISHNNIRVSIT